MLTTLIFITLLSSGHSLMGMETTLALPQTQPQQNVATQMRVSNDTREKLLLCIHVKPKTSLAIALFPDENTKRIVYQTLIPQQSIDLDPREFECVQVKPYGIIKGLISADTIYLGLSNLIDIVNTHFVEDGACLKITVRPHTQPHPTHGYFMYALAWISERARSYTFCTESFYPIDLNEYHTILDPFDQAEILANFEPCHPRFILNLPEWASRSDVNFSYGLLRTRWVKNREQGNPQMQEYAERIVVVLDEAQLALVDNENLETYKETMRGYLTANTSFAIMPEVHASMDQIFGREIAGRLHEQRSLEDVVAVLKDLYLNNKKFRHLILNQNLAELTFRFISQRLYESQSFGNLSKVALSLKETCSQLWFFQKIRTSPECRRNVKFVYGVYEKFSDSFYRPIAGDLINYEDSRNLIDKDGDTPLMVAILKGDIDLAMLLVARGALCLLTNSVGQTALTLAQDRKTIAIAANQENAYQWGALIISLKAATK